MYSQPRALHLDTKYFSFRRQRERWFLYFILFLYKVNQYFYFCIENISKRSSAVVLAY